MTAFPYPIHELKEGERIMRDGFWSVPMERHHGPGLCAGPHVTSGVLRRMIKHGPEYTWAFHHLNPHKYEDPDSPAKSFGRLVATALEQGIDGINQLYKVVPENAPQRPTKPQLKAAEEGKITDSYRERAAFWEPFDALPGEEVEQERLDQLTGMMRALINKPAARVILGGVPELDMVWLDQETGLWVASRMDNIRGDGVVSDYKTADPGQSAFNHASMDRKMDQFGYFQQGALGAEGWEQLTGEKPSAVAFLFQMPKPPFSVLIREVDLDELQIGHMLNKLARRQFADCYREGLKLKAQGRDPALAWPGPDADQARYKMSDGYRQVYVRMLARAGMIQDAE